MLCKRVPIEEIEASMRVRAERSTAGELQRLHAGLDGQITTVRHSVWYLASRWLPWQSSAERSLASLYAVRAVVADALAERTTSTELLLS